jgi:hypothetical protein
MKARKKGALRGPKVESRHGKIAEGTSRRLLQASTAQWAEWDDAAARVGLSFNAWARQALNIEARRGTERPKRDTA